MSKKHLYALTIFVVLALGGSTGILTADDSECGVHTLPQAAAGKWHGSFWVEYEPSIEHVNVPITMRWQASLEFDVIRASDGGLRKDDEDGVIHGKAEGEMKLEMKGNIQGHSFNQTAQGSGPVEFAIEGKEQNPDWQFKRIELRRAEGQIGFNTTQTIKGPEGEVTSSGAAGAGGSTQGHTHGETRSGTFDKSYSGGYDRVFGKPDDKPKATWFLLNVEQRTCATMMGTIDRDAFQARLESSGIRGHVAESNWAATYDDRDVEFEQEVQDLVNRIPNPPKFEYAKRHAEQFVQLRGGAEQASNYRLCVLQPLKEKIIQISIMHMRQEAQRLEQMEYARFSQVAPSMLSVVQAMRVLQLLGAGDCPLAKDLDALIKKKAREAVKVVCKNNPTRTELAEIGRQWQLGAFDMGDATSDFVQAWKSLNMPGEPGSQ